MTLNEREAFKTYLKTKGIVKIDWNCLGVITNVVREAGCTLGYNDIELMQEVWEAKAQAVPVKQSLTLTCAELKEAFDFGAPDGEKDQFQMETEMTIRWLKDGYDGEGYYCWYADLPEEGCIKLGKSESGVEE
ncbi:hypothetical protein ACRVDH_16565 [Acinetobacter baumannii]|uniref:Uncharacterized protein n=1 Tax=Acinetobacter pittii ANC 4050 TaxID=1217691 RepID=R8YNL8_ACIPI|nr:hypothetical protein [Acinetobacter pittii]ELS6313931.1 hypothetical protein [Acinetobacter baumannii]EOQ69067.1 hypothetical protein F931_01786 [Acinetobacter pittii ANC 4050]